MPPVGRSVAKPRASTEARGFDVSGVMQIAVYSAKPFDRTTLDAHNRDHGHELTYYDTLLGPATANLARGFPAVSAFVNDRLDAETLARLADGGTRLVALRAAGFNNVDLDAAARHGLTVARVPAYSPHAIAEHAVALALALNRKLHRAYNRVREGDFSLTGLTGYDLHGKTVGVVGTGAIGRAFARIMRGFGCAVVAHDPHPDDTLRGEGVRYAPLSEVLAQAHLTSLHCPLTPATYHLLDAEAFAETRPGATLINTSRGGLVDADAAVEALKSGRLGALGIDVYEQEEGLFFNDLRGEILHDDTIARLLTFPNVIVTAHQGFLTREALDEIAAVTLANVTAFARGERSGNEVGARD